MHLTSALRLAKQLSSRGYSHLLTTSFRSTKILLHLRNHLKFVQLMHSNPNLAKLIQIYPRLIYRYLGNYLAIHLSTSTKLTILENHYRFLLQYTHIDFFRRVLKKTYLWQETHNNDQYSIVLEFQFGRDYEGDLSLVFEFNSLPIYVVSFSFIPGKAMSFQFDQAIFVGRIQGLASFELIRNMTKNLYDIAPPALLMAALQGVALAFKIDTIIGVNNEKQLSSTKAHIYFDYDLFWSSLTAYKTKENWFALPVPFLEKPIEMIKNNHRRRTLNKRQYKNKIREETFARFREVLQ